MEIQDYLQLRHEGIPVDRIEKLIAQRDSYRKRVAALECVVLRAIAKKGNVTPEQMTERLKDLINVELQDSFAQGRIKELIALDYSMDAAKSPGEWADEEDAA